MRDRATGRGAAVQAQDCFAGRIPNEDVTMKDLNFSYGFTNPAAGPVYIEGAEPGDVLVVDIYDVQVADHGVIATDDHCSRCTKRRITAARSSPSRTAWPTSTA